MSKLNEFRNMIDVISDIDSAIAAKSLLDDMIELNRLKEKEQQIRDSMLDDGKAMFYFFAEELNYDELLFASERMAGRIKRIERDNQDKEKE